MAASKTFTRSHYQYFTGTTTGKNTTTTISDFELDESDVWNNNISTSPPQKHTMHSSKRMISTKSSSSPVNVTTPSSLPVNVPDWSKILKQDYRENRRDYTYDDGEFEEYEGGACRIPPHEFLAKQMAASFSVHEGVGRTLKGRDLSRAVVRTVVFLLLHGR
ncbi:hypothetical protein CTI12_AA611170 [Artemisia annua]|uniref:Uncharacterized protein n=1 Tax=Artemisia annua TaxID=35608 RepID=A0A2U1KEC9_ARTAN|nr:hypothetical protein CTI12_AA611170 [Artemisia annua]